MGQQFNQLHNEIASIKAHSGRDTLDEYLIQEMLRFHSLGGSIIATFQQAGTNVDQRIISHILIRSVIENFFKILYIKHDPSQSQARFELCVNGFKQQYLKLYNDPGLDPATKGQLQAPDPIWRSLSQPMDLNSMITNVMSIHGQRLTPVYVIYRISSFDTHGNTHEILFNESFNVSPCNFPVLKVEKVIDLIANEYLVLWNKGNML